MRSGSAALKPPLGEAAAMRVLWYVAAITTLSSGVSFETAALAADLRMEGRVVEYRTDSGIKDVTVRVKDGPENATIIVTTQTDGSGNFKFTVPDTYADVWIDYIPKDTQKYGTYGRSNVQNGALDKKVDTVGLAAISGAKDPAIARVIAAGIAMFVLSGGDVSTAREVAAAAKSHNPAFDLVLREVNPEVLRRLQR